MPTGEAKSWNEARGFGFIVPDDGSEDVHAWNPSRSDSIQQSSKPKTSAEARWIGEARTSWTICGCFLRSIPLSREHLGDPTYSRTSRHCARDPQVFVHRGNLQGCEALVAGDKVQYEAIYDDRTRSGEKPPGELHVTPLEESLAWSSKHGT